MGRDLAEVTAVSPEEWQSIQTELRASYNQIKQLILETSAWPSEREIGGAIATIVHTAYHLGEIRQALCTLKA
ncbi:MAG: hypothetical protein M5U34_03355 [Chloroflexi bacterium]|nr:hypothetical protein [Chloroflexota bacterium]